MRLLPSLYQLLIALRNTKPLDQRRGTRHWTSANDQAGKKHTHPPVTYHSPLIVIITTRRLKSLANRQFEVKHRVSFERITKGLSKKSKTGDATVESKADAESGGMGDDTSVDVQQQKSSAIEPALPEMQAHAELDELTVMGVGDAVEQSEDNLVSEVSLGGNKNGKKNKVYVAPIEDDEFHEA